MGTFGLPLLKTKHIPAPDLPNCEGAARCFRFRSSEPRGRDLPRRPATRGSWSKNLRVHVAGTTSARFARLRQVGSLQVNTSRQDRSYLTKAPLSGAKTLSATVRHSSDCWSSHQPSSQFSDGLSTLSMTRIGIEALVDSSFRPSWSRRASRGVGPIGSDATGESEPAGVRRSRAHSSSEGLC